MNVPIFLFLNISTFFLLFPSYCMANQCYEASVVSPTPFMGNNGEIVKLSDGSIWEVKNEYEYLYEYNPEVIVCPNRGKIILNDKSLSVALLSASKQNQNTKNDTSSSNKIIESIIVSNFDGLNYGNIYKLANGQVWEQTESWIWTWTWMNPTVIIWNDGGVFKMKVDQIEHAVSVEQLK